MPGDNTATIATGSPIEFHQDGITNGIITPINSSQFNIPLRWNLYGLLASKYSRSRSNMLQLNGTEIARSVAVKATGIDQIIGETIIITTEPNSNKGYESKWESSCNYPKTECSWYTSCFSESCYKTYSVKLSNF